MIIHRAYFIIILSAIIFVFLFQNGCKEDNSVATNNPTKKAFAFPLRVGATWKYYYTQAGVIALPLTGLHTWKVIGTDGTGNWNCIDIRMDSAYGTLRVNDSVSFVIRDYPDYIRIEFPEWVGLFDTSRIVPKLVDAASDTVKFAKTITSGIWIGREQVACVNGIGLVEYSGKSDHMTAEFHSLLLIEYSFPSGQKRH